VQHVAKHFSHFDGFLRIVNAGRFFRWLFGNACPIFIENTITIFLSAYTGTGTDTSGISGSYRFGYVTGFTG
jgi:hypothetical protein